MKVKRVIRWQNGMVMVFGTDGEQISELQGRYSEVKDRVLAAADDKTEFRYGVWNQSLITISRDTWQSM
jgi:hypothetical protein